MFSGSGIIVGFAERVGGVAGATIDSSTATFFALAVFALIVVHPVVFSLTLAGLFAPILIESLSVFAHVLAELIDLLRA